MPKTYNPNCDYDPDQLDLSRTKRKPVPPRPVQSEGFDGLAEILAEVLRKKSPLLNDIKQAMQRAWGNYADANDIPHDHEDEETFKVGFNLGASFELTALRTARTDADEMRQMLEEADGFEFDGYSIIREGWSDGYKYLTWDETADEPLERFDSPLMAWKSIKERINE